jgi:hypothetical protein
VSDAVVGRVEATDSVHRTIVELTQDILHSVFDAIETGEEQTEEIQNRPSNPPTPDRRYVAHP